MNDRSKSRSAARLAAVQALYQLEMEGTPLHLLLHEHSFGEHDICPHSMEPVELLEAQMSLLLHGLLAPPA